MTGGTRVPTPPYNAKGLVDAGGTQEACVRHRTQAFRRGDREITRAQRNPDPGQGFWLVVRKPRHDTERDLSFTDTISHTGRRITAAAAAGRARAARASRCSRRDPRALRQARASGRSSRTTPTWCARPRRVRQSTLDEIKALGADTLRVEVKWNEVAPAAGLANQAELRRHRPGRLSGLLAVRRPDAARRPRWASGS